MTKDQESEEKKLDKTEDAATEKNQKEKLMDEQYEFGLNEDVREEIEKEDGHREPDDKADETDEVINDEAESDE